MPSHPDRVRRNYHELSGGILADPTTMAWGIQYYITRLEITSWISVPIAKRMIWNKFSKEIDRCFR